MKTFILVPLVSLALAPLASAQSGAVIPAPPLAPQTTISVPKKPTLPATDDTSRMPDGILKLNSVVYIIKGGVPTRVDTERFMRVSPQGVVTGFDGTTWTVPNGQLFGLDGSTVQVPGTLLDTRAVEQAMMPPSENARNYSGLAPTPAVPTPQPKDALSTSGGNINAAGGQIQSTGRSGTNRNRGGTAGNTTIDGVDTVVAPDANLSGTAQGQTGLPGQANTGTNASGIGGTSGTTNATTNPNARSTTGAGTGSRAGGTTGTTGTSATGGTTGASGTRTGGTGTGTSTRSGSTGTGTSGTSGGTGASGGGGGASGGGTSGGGTSGGTSR